MGQRHRLGHSDCGRRATDCGANCGDRHRRSQRRHVLPGIAGGRTRSADPDPPTPPRARGGQRGGGGQGPPVGHRQRQGRLQPQVRRWAVLAQAPRLRSRRRAVLRVGRRRRHPQQLPPPACPSDHRSDRRPVFRLSDHARLRRGPGVAVRCLLGRQVRPGLLGAGRQVQAAHRIRAAPVGHRHHLRRAGTSHQPGAQPRHRPPNRG